MTPLTWLTWLQGKAVEGVMATAVVADMGRSWGGGRLAGRSPAGQESTDPPPLEGSHRQGRAETRLRWLISVCRLSTNQRTSEHLGSLISAPRLRLPREKIAVVTRVPPKTHGLQLRLRL